MSEPVFVIQNQHGLYLTRQNEWNDGHEPGALFKTPFRDVALNTLIELNAKDIELRGSIVSVSLSEKGVPQVTPVDAVSPAPALDEHAVATDATTEDAEQNELIAEDDSDAFAVTSADEETSEETSTSDTDSLVDTH